jgi:hypothetical protein
MEEQDIIPTIDILLVEIDAVIAALNDQGAHLFSEGKYDQARALLNKVEGITGFRGKVLCLKSDWKSLRVPAVVKGALKDMGDAGARVRSRPLKPGLKTPPDAFRYPILEALDRLEGAGRVRDVFRVLEEILSEQLNTYPCPRTRIPCDGGLPLTGRAMRWSGRGCWRTIPPAGCGRSPMPGGRR